MNLEFRKLKNQRCKLLHRRHRAPAELRETKTQFFAHSVRYRVHVSGRSFLLERPAGCRLDIGICLLFRIRPLSGQFLEVWRLLVWNLYRSFSAFADMGRSRRGRAQPGDFSSCGADFDRTGRLPDVASG